MEFTQQRRREPRNRRQSASADAIQRRHVDVSGNLEADDTVVSHGNGGCALRRLDIAVFTCVVT